MLAHVVAHSTLTNAVLRRYAPLRLSRDKGILHRVAVLVATDGAGSRHLQTSYLGAVKALNLDSLRCPRGRPYLGGRSVSHFQGALLGLALMMSFKDRGVPVLRRG